MNTRSIILAAVLAVCSAAANAQVDREPGEPMPKPTPAPVERQPGKPMPKPRPATFILVDHIDYAPANRYADRGDLRTLQQAQAYTDAASQHTETQVTGLQREAFAGIAQAAALVPMEPRFDGESTLNVGAATYGGQPALGLAISHQTGNTVLNAGVGFGGKRTLVRVGLGWRF